MSVTQKIELMQRRRAYLQRKQFHSRLCHCVCRSPVVNVDQCLMWLLSFAGIKEVDNRSWTW